MRVQDVGLQGEEDEEVLAWAAVNERLVLTRDYSTLLRCAYLRIKAGLRCPGVFAVNGMGLMVEEILTIEQRSEAAEWDGQVVFLPLR